MNDSRLDRIRLVLLFVLWALIHTVAYFGIAPERARGNEGELESPTLSEPTNENAPPLDESSGQINRAPAAITGPEKDIGIRVSGISSASQANRLDQVLNERLSSVGRLRKSKISRGWIEYKMVTGLSPEKVAEQVHGAPLSTSEASSLGILRTSGHSEAMVSFEIAGAAFP